MQKAISTTSSSFYTLLRMIKTIRYHARLAQEWDEFVGKARNSTLLHLRNYMDYHSDRFQDASLLFYDERQHLVALLPACISRKDSHTIVSHEGLTYGGLLTEPLTHTFVIEQALDAAMLYYKEELQASQLVIKHIPYIYSSQPADEELYFIHSRGGSLTARGLSQTIDLTRPLPLNTLRQRCLSRAAKAQLEVRIATQREEWDQYHSILTKCVARHGFAPVHSADELWMLHTRFPQHIVLYATFRKESLIAGAVLYISPNVAHAQYLAVSDEGKQCGALDMAIHTAVHDPRIKQCRYFDFGISTERDGTLNHGLTLQKEGFGARGICYDIYQIPL